MRILIIGGSGFAGAHFARVAVDQGHRVSSFSRGAKARHVEGVEYIHGDRLTGLARVARTWDAVVDFAAFLPHGVRVLADALANKVGHYTVISSVMAYRRTVEPMHEGNQTLAYSGRVSPYDVRKPTEPLREYGELKAVCEHEAINKFAEALVIRPGVLTGPGDEVDHLAFWFERLEHEGKVLVPGDPLDPVQFLDARDLARWTMDMVETNATGIYNAVGPETPLTMSRLMEALMGQCGGDATLEWVPTEWLESRGVRGSEAPFFWSSNRARERANDLWVNYRVDGTKARAKGLRCRPLEATVADNAAWFRALDAARRLRPGSGWSPDRELALLREWQAR